jgi:hypothetical protein
MRLLLTAALTSRSADRKDGNRSGRGRAQVAIGLVKDCSSTGRAKACAGYKSYPRSKVSRALTVMLFLLYDSFSCTAII